jgi:Acyl-CoA oxidase
MAHAHMMYVTFQIFRAALDRPDQIKCPKLKEHLKDLARVYAINELLNGQDTSAVYEAGHFPAGISQTLLNAQKGLMTKLRPQMIPLIEAWDFQDSQLVSAIGNSYGDIYE